MAGASETSSTQRNIPAYPELVSNLIGGKKALSVVASACPSSTPASASRSPNLRRRMQAW